MRAPCLVDDERRLQRCDGGEAGEDALGTLIGALATSLPQMIVARLIQGMGRFADDVRLDRQTYAAFLRSPHAHADILSIDATRARALPGVLAVLTGEGPPVAHH